MHRLWRRSYLRRPLLLPPQRSAGIATVVEIVPEPSVTMAIMRCDYEDESHAVQRTEELLQSFTMFRSNPRSKRQRHVSSYCACTSCLVSPHAIVVEPEEKRPCFQNRQHKHLQLADWMSKNACALCKSST